MAKISAAAFKLAIASAAVELNFAFDDDDVAAEMANEFRDPRHALRDLNKLFLIDPDTGILSANNAYIDGNYAGLSDQAAAGDSQKKTKVPYDVALG